jgi:diguanylate cyclase (GGDEF)-like protein/PAS domain S-box-containing protein
MVGKEQEHRTPDLRHNEAFLRILVHEAPLMLMAKEAGTGRFVFWNRQCELVTGHQGSQVIGKTAHDLFPPAQATLFHVGDEEVYQKGKPIVFPALELTARDGDRRIVRIIKTPVFLGPDNSFVVAYAQDITAQHEAERRMTEQRLLTDAILNSIPIQVAVVDERGVILAANQAWRQLAKDSGVPEEALVQGGNYLEVCARVQADTEQARLVEKGLKEVLAGGRDTLVIEPDAGGDADRYLMKTITPLRYCEKRGAVIVCTDITAQKKAENIIRARHRQVQEQVRERTEEVQLFEKIFSASLEGITLTDTEGTILNVNDAFTAITGYARDEVVGQNPRVLKSEKHKAAFYQRMWRQLISEGRWEGEIWNRRKSGEIYPEWLSISAITNSQGVTTHYVAVFHDITEIKEKEAQISTLAYYDPLTGLPNRALMLDRLSVVLEQASRDRLPVAVLFLDLDNFKLVNDSLGHPVGDRLLTLIGKHLDHILPPESTVSRIGGDEFVIVTPVRQDNAVSYLAEHILVSFSEQPFRIDDHEFFVTASIGIAFFPDDGETPDQLVKNADIAMYQAKTEGKNCFRLFDQRLNDKLLEQVVIERDLRAALRRESFPVYYQPKVEVESGRIVGMEALVRWRREDGSLVPPGMFIPVAEETGLIRELGRQVLVRACRDTLALHAAGYNHLRVSVNISAVQFAQPGLVAEVLQVLRETGLDAAFLDLEITETVLMADLERTERSLRELTREGITLSIDDFGTGYSSLYYLKRFPLSTIKIDGSFVNDIATDKDDAAIVRAILQMAASLHLETVAEGVEDRCQLDFLRRHGCDLVQGYYYSPPVPYEQFHRLVAKSRVK